jgi:YVTN family beta-propeller protein
MRTHPRSLLLPSAFALLGGVVLSGLAPVSAHAATSVYELSSTITVGSSPRAVELNPLTDKLYVANEDADTVSVISTVTGAVTSTIPVGSNPSAIAINTVTNRIYVANSGGNSVSVIDGTTDASLGPVTVGASPLAIAVNQTTNQVYVSSSGLGMLVIDGLTGSVSTLMNYDGFTGIVVNETQNLLYAVDNANEILFEFNASTGANTKRTWLERGLFGVAFNEVTGRIYVTGLTDDTLTVINAASFAEIAVVAVGGHPFAVEVDRISNTVFVANRDDGTISVVDGATNLVDSTVALGTVTQDLAFDGATNRLYATSSPSSVAVLSEPVAPAITVSALPPATVGTVYSAMITTTGSNPIGFAVTSGALPAGLSLNPSTGAISGTPDAAGSGTFTVTATNAVGSASQALTIVTADVLPPTGFDAMPWLFSAASALLIGGTLIVFSRRAQRRSARAAHLD